MSIDVTDCATNIGFAGIGAVDGPLFPSHGSAILRISGSNWVVDYVHNGDAATSDAFEFTDGTIAGNTVRVTITISASTSPITITPGTLPALVAGTMISQTLSSAGGTAPYTYSVSAGALIPGLNLSTGGVISGAPSRRGAYTFSVTAQDALGVTAVKSYAGTVSNPSLSLATGTVTLVQGAAASAQLATNGGVAPYIYATEPPGTPMPFGLSLSTGGLITGTPSSSGSASVQLRVTDSSSGPGQYFEL
ncbi:MAG TPA: putative Ig domain-containing protein, partial [Sphingopyxis terrae]|nr:putative Ig domain-containing protein [Sphingopyxis terrae]